MEEKRATEINFALGLIETICEESEIALIPYTLKNGQQVVAIHDNQNGKISVMVKKEK
ncbi:hypothetical protein QTH27_12610 [Clostridium perfringens]|uniref:Uncharacterized protein n=1 Tax=Clostridium perfringens TaxID=1502 RepID=A0AAP4A9Z6_CLOPF|nr:hypothetical protein [Clostridium perfringens]MDH2337336.1 hypothetical protein [Clostridium perfringens]MDM0478619.1 hypothetical protein [Clostridium perfringens]